MPSREELGASAVGPSAAGSGGGAASVAGPSAGGGVPMSASLSTVEKAAVAFVFPYHKFPGFQVELLH